MSKRAAQSAIPSLIARLRRMEETVLLTSYLRVGFLALIAVAAAWPG